MWPLLLPAQPFTLSHLPFPESSLTKAPLLLTLYPLKTSSELQGPKVPFRLALCHTVLPDFPLKSALHCSHHLALPAASGPDASPHTLVTTAPLHSLKS